jgi:hypothetical protein
MHRSIIGEVKQKDRFAAVSPKSNQVSSLGGRDSNGVIALPARPTAW